MPFSLRDPGPVPHLTHNSLPSPARVHIPNLCSDQSSAGTVREAVYRRRPGLPSRRTHYLEQSAPSLSTFRQRLKTFLFQASFPDIIVDPGKLFPICRLS